MRASRSAPLLILAALVALPSFAVPASQGDSSPDATAGWPQFRGPDRTGHAAAALPWTDAGPRVRWAVDIGPSFATVAARGDRIWTAYSDAEREYLASFDADTGEQLWKTPVGDVFVSEFGNGPRATPTLDGDRVVLLGGRGRLVSANAVTGEIVWAVDLVERFGAQVPRFGYSGSALVVGDALLLEVGGKDDAALVLFDRDTGETRATLLEGPAGYSSPMVATLAGREQIVLVRGRTVVGLGTDGSELWAHPVQGGVVAMPVPVGDDRLFVSAGDDTGCVLLRVSKEDDAYAVEELWANRNMRNHFNSSVLVDDVLYGFDNATLKALDAATGELLWGKRGLGKGSLAVAGDVIAVLTDKGELKFLRADRAGYRELGAVQAIEGKSWTSPSIAGGRVYVRNHERMACVELGG
jgi:outer membrane protein assembly factor BamB